jgi:hypothetical protein
MEIAPLPLDDDNARCNFYPQSSLYPLREEARAADLDSLDEIRLYAVPQAQANKGLARAGRQTYLFLET